jgi:hypothetical protein
MGNPNASNVKTSAGPQKKTPIVEPNASPAKNVPRKGPCSDCERSAPAASPPFKAARGTDASQPQRTLDFPMVAGIRSTNAHTSPTRSVGTPVTSPENSWDIAPKIAAVMADSDRATAATFNRRNTFGAANEVGIITLHDSRQARARRTPSP